jgi:uncharacterized protein YeaO (DUF488 family)
MFGFRLNMESEEASFMPIFLKRAYEKSKADDGKRILVERLWPRGLKKEDAKIDEWLKDVAPTTKLRKWYGHDPAKWAKFEKKYWKELEDKETLLSRLAIESSRGKITFVFGSKEEKLNNAAALKEYIETKCKQS